MFWRFYKSSFDAKDWCRLGDCRSHFRAPTLIGTYSWLWPCDQQLSTIMSRSATTVQFVPMKQVLPRGEFVQMFETQERRIRSSNYFSITGGRWWEVELFNIQKLKVESQTQLLNGLENCLNSAKNLEDIVYGSWLVVLHTVTHCESFGSLWKSVVLSQDLNSLSLVWIEYSTSVLNSFST